MSFLLFAGLDLVPFFIKRAQVVIDIFSSAGTPGRSCPPSWQKGYGGQQSQPGIRCRTPVSAPPGLDRLVLRPAPRRIVFLFIDIGFDVLRLKQKNSTNLAASAECFEDLDTVRRVSTAEINLFLAGSLVAGNTKEPSSTFGFAFF